MNAYGLALKGILLLAAFAIATPVAAEDWPTRNVTVIVPLGPGSASDTLARLVMDQVGRQLGHTFVIENRTGAGGTIGANLAAKAAPNGYTLLSYGALAASNALYPKLPYDVLSDFIPVAVLGQQPLAVVTSPSKGYKTLGDLIAAAKARPGALNYSSSGAGTATHFALERLRVSAGIEAQHIPYRGAQESLTEIMTGRVDFGVQTFSSTLQLIREGKVLALAVSARQRSIIMPEVPTVIEAGLLPDAVYPFYSAVFLPAKTPRDIVEKLHREIARSLEAVAVRERLAAMGVEPMPMSLSEFAQFFRDVVAANLALAKAAKLQVQ